jgi:DNA-binding NarL/FixJ family response regulator
VPIRCLLVDDDDRFLRAARRMLEHEGIEVVGVATTSAEALQRADELNPDVSLVDISLGEESGFDLAERLAAARPCEGPTVILISAYAEQDLAERIEASPAAGFVPKIALSGEAIHAILGGADST